ncbi:N-acetylmuramoyl-L-alanine amidase [Bacillus sp. Y1]|nr:N-acetylmuramoyl-L-alanine amidase [Bacillus sp. Y1]AYA77330.1 N-acetylmuramoyl-L-alanine amidase [Bacillus sp. Y1]
MKIMLDAGHGPETPGKRSPDGMKEFDFNCAVANAMKAELEQYEGVNVLFAHEPSRDVPLVERTNKANAQKADLFVSLHADALNGVMGDHGGITTFVYKTNPTKSRMLADVIQRNVIAATGLRNRGVKTADFHVLRETNMEAVLIEHGFMDSRTDLPKLKDANYRNLCGVTNAKSIAEVYGLKRKIVAQAPADSADGKLTRGERGPNVAQLNAWLRELEYTTKTDDLYDQYTEAAFKAFLKDAGLSQDTVYTSAIGDLLVKAIADKTARVVARSNLIAVDAVPTKRPDKYRLAKFIDTDNVKLIEQYKAEGYKVIEQPSEVK